MMLRLVVLHSSTYLTLTIYGMHGSFGFKIKFYFNSNNKSPPLPSHHQFSESPNLHIKKNIVIVISFLPIALFQALFRQIGFMPMNAFENESKCLDTLDSADSIFFFSMAHLGVLKSLTSLFSVLESGLILT